MAHHNGDVGGNAAGELIAYEKVEIRSSQYSNDAFLIVSGEQPEQGWKAMLVPSIYREKQEYLPVEIVKVRDFEAIEQTDRYYNNIYCIIMA